MPVKRTPSIEQPQLTPRARPVDTFVRPEAPLLSPDPAQPTALLRLVDSLSSLSPKLARLGSAYQEVEGDTGKSEALGLRLSTTRDELTRRINAGDIPPEVNRDVLELEHGEDIARAHSEDMRQRYLGQNTSTIPGQNNAFDRDTGDLDAFFKEVAREKEAELPRSEASVYGWRKWMTAFQQQLYAEHDGYVAQRTKERNLDGAYRDIYQTAVGAISTGERDPAKLHGLMRQAFGKTAKLHMLTPAEADEAMVVAAKSIADQGIPGNPQLGVDLVKEIFLGKRDSVPPLGNSAKYADMAVKTIEAAQKTAGELQRKLNLETAVELRDAAATGTLNEKEFIKFVESNEHIFSQAEKEAILLQNRNSLATAREKQTKLVEKLAAEANAQASELEIDAMLRRASDEGTLLTIPEKISYIKSNGEPGAYSRKEAIDRRIETFFRETDAWAESKRGEAEAAGLKIEDLKLERQIVFFAKNLVKNPQWADVLNAGFAGATPPALAGHEAPPSLLQAVNLYEQLEAKAPGLLRQHIDNDDARDFYSTVRVARTLLRQDARQALVTAAQATNDAEENPAAFAPAYDKLERALSGASSFWPWSDGIINYGEMTSDVRRLGRALVRAGVKPTEALRAAGNEVVKQYANINGYMVRTADTQIANFGGELASLKLQPRAFEEVIRDYLGLYAADDRDADSLSIRSVTEGTGTWAVIDADTGFPVSSASGLSQVFSMRDLIAFEKDRQSGEIEKKLKELRNRNAASTYVEDTAVYGAPLSPEEAERRKKYSLGAFVEFMREGIAEGEKLRAEHGGAYPDEMIYGKPKSQKATQETPKDRGDE